MGLIVAESSSPLELSKDYGKTKTQLQLQNVWRDACMDAVNETTIFLAGGYLESEPIVNTFQSSVGWDGDSYKLVDNKGLDGNYQRTTTFGYAAERE